MREQIVLSPVTPCEYLPDRLSRHRYEVDVALRPADYMERMAAGWRRFGPVLFQPDCPDCRMCQSLRIPIETFTPNESQRRAWKKNVREVTIRIGTPTVTPDKQQLFADFHQHGHDTKGWPRNDARLHLFVSNPFETEEWSYYLGDRLIAVGYVDQLFKGLSAIYFYYDPAERHRSLGTFNILALIVSARLRRLPHVYLGYYVEGCRSLEYKARFGPSEVLQPDGAWVPFTPPPVR